MTAPTTSGFPSLSAPAPMVLLLTATIDARGIAFLERRDANLRLEDYKRALTAWLTNRDTPPLVFAENSGYPLAELQRIATETNKHNHRIEFLSFDDNSFPRTLGKGFGELRIIRRALDQSALIGPDTLIVKVTGRYYVENIGSLGAKAKSASDIDVFCDLRGDLTWADTRVFCARTSFLRDFFLPMEAAVDDSAGITLEHVMGRSVHAAMSRGRRWAMLPRAPRIRGISATSGIEYPNSAFATGRQEVFRALKAAVLAR